MRSFAIVSGLIALASTTVVPHEASCGPTGVPIGAPCTVEGNMGYDSSCSSILICHDGVTMLNNACSPGGCFWNEEVGSPYCGESAGEMLEKPDEPEIVTFQRCGPGTLHVGSPCGLDMQEGDMACDAGCKNILICHKGKMMLNSPCNSGQCVWRDDTELPYCIPPGGSISAGDEPKKTLAKTGSTRSCGFAVDVDEKCPTIAREGHRFCSSDCSGILECNKGAMKLVEKCETWCATDDHKQLGKGANCMPEASVSVESTITEDIPPWQGVCGFTQEAGAKCSVLIKEGGRLCDKNCRNVLKCKNGIMEIETDCRKEMRSCKYDKQKPLGKGAFCDRNPPVEILSDDKLSSSAESDRIVAKN